MDRRLKTIFALRKMTLAAFLLVLNVLFINLSNLFLVEGLSFVRPSLSPAIVIFSSLICGPFYGAIVGGAGDILAILLRGGAMGINPLITVLYMALGALPYFLYRYGKSLKKIYSNVVFLGVALGLFLVVSLLAINLPGLFDEFDAGVIAIVRPVLSVLLSLFTVLAGVGIYFYQKKVGKEGGFTPYDGFFIAFVSELFLMVLWKSIAFYFFYAYLSGGTPIPYSFLLASLLLLCPFNVLVNTYAVTFLISLMKKLKKGEVEPQIDESSLKPEDLAEYKASAKVPLGWIIFFGVLILAIVACLIVIFVL